MAPAPGKERHAAGPPQSGACGPEELPGWRDAVSTELEGANDDGSPRGFITGSILLALSLTAAACSDRSPDSTTPTVSSPTVSPTPSTGEPAVVSWRPLPKAPIVGRIGAGVVWTGEEMIVWGGVSRRGAIEPVRDGAAYDPVADSWRGIAPAPSRVLGAVGTAAAWTGTTAVFWAGNSPDGPTAGGVYDPTTDRIGSAIVWSGSDLIAWSGTVSGRGTRPPTAVVRSR
jgi:hypothetical protein